jgi:hypothetical protein
VGSKTNWNLVRLRVEDFAEGMMLWSAGSIISWRIVVVVVVVVRSSRRMWRRMKMRMLLRCRWDILGRKHMMICTVILFGRGI